MKLLLRRTLVRLDITGLYLSLPAMAALRYVAKQFKTVLLISNEVVPSCIEALSESGLVGGDANKSENVGVNKPQSFMSYFQPISFCICSKV